MCIKYTKNSHSNFFPRVCSVSGSQAENRDVDPVSHRCHKQPETPGYFGVVAHLLVTCPRSGMSHTCAQHLVGPPAHPVLCFSVQLRTHLTGPFKSSLSHFTILKFENSHKNMQKSNRKGFVITIKANLLSIHLSIAAVKIALTSPSCGLRMKYTLLKAHQNK